MSVLCLVPEICIVPRELVSSFICEMDNKYKYVRKICYMYIKILRFQISFININKCIDILIDVDIIARHGFLNFIDICILCIKVQHAICFIQNRTEENSFQSRR